MTPDSSDGTESDAESEHTGQPDASGDAGPRCDPSKPFPPPTVVDELDIGVATYARLTPDMKLVVFGGTPDDTSVQLFWAKRDSVDEPFSTPTPVPGIDTLDGGSPLQAAAPTISPDKLRLYFQSSRNGRVQIFLSTRASEEEPFGPPLVVDELDDPKNTGQPYLSSDGSTMVFVSRREEGSVGAIDLWRTEISPSGAAVGFINITELNTVEDDEGPTISADGLTIYFSRGQLADGGASPGQRIWSASRSSTTEAFDNLTPMTSLWLESGSDYPNWISPDGCTIYLSSNSSGKYKIYTSTRPQ